MDALTLLEEVEKAFPLPAGDLRHHHLIRNRETGALQLNVWWNGRRVSLDLAPEEFGLRIAEVIERVLATI